MLFLYFEIVYPKTDLQKYCIFEEVTQAYNLNIFNC